MDKVGVMQRGESMSREAGNFFRLHGDASIEMLKDGIFRALAEEDDAKALHLDRLLREIENVLRAGSLTDHDWSDSIPN